MSFGLMLLDPLTFPTVEQIYEILEAGRAGVAAQPAHEGGDREECTSRWAAFDHAGDPVDVPWASWPLAGEEGALGVEIEIRHDCADKMLSALVEVAEHHDIVLYDPQADEVHLPARLRQRD